MTDRMEEFFGLREAAERPPRSDAVFTEEDAARKWLEARRWPDGAVCPWCDRADPVSALGGSSMGAGWYHCRDCRRKFTVRMGTVCERSHVPLHKWLLAARLLATVDERAITAELVRREIGVSYKTAWRMLQQLRKT